MRRDIVKLIEAEKDITNAIVLTHNIDFIFIQSLVLPALRLCGHPSLTIFADAQCASESFQHQHMVLDSLGKRFRVVPVSLNPGFRFHPKAILLSGEKKGVLLVGSGNLTFGGWRENAEVWGRFDSDLDGSAPFSAFLDYLNKIVELAPLREGLMEEVNKCFDEPWAQKMEPSGGLLGRPFGNDSLIDQMKDVLQEKPVQSLLIHSPYFDLEGNALKILSSKFGVQVGVNAQVKRSGLSIEVSAALNDAICVKTVNFHHAAADAKLREAFIHAKWYAFEHEDSFTVFLGSANCSNAALTIFGNAGNAELMMFKSLTKEDFVSNFLRELELLDDDDPELPSKPDNIPDNPSLPYINISAAQLKEECLQIAYSCSDEISLHEHILLDGKQYDFLKVEPGIIVIKSVPTESRIVCLQGVSDSQVIRSNLHWIDCEKSLSTSAYSRSLIDAVRMKVQSQYWSLGAWSDIANVFLRNLQYMPKRTSNERASIVKSIRGESDKKHYTAEDVFSDSYESQVSSQFVLTFPVGFDDRVTSLRQLLMRWFGYKDEVEQDSGGALSEEYYNDADDVVDRLETLPEQKNSKNADSQVIRKLTESDRRRALKILGMVTEQMASEAYLLERQPEAISVDIQFASVLLRSGLCEKWITEEEFFESTHKIWSALFFTSSYNTSCGWLEYRFLTSEDQGEFINKLVSPKLTAALTAWALAIPDEIFSINQIKFSLSKILSVARLRWLWQNDNRDEVDKELQELLVSSVNNHSDHFWDDFQARWIEMIRNGNALRILEKKLSSKTPGELKDQISHKEVKRGDLLWQGINGFCIATEDFMRGERNTPILYLQRNKKDNSNEDKIRSAYAIPIKSVVIERIIDLDEAPSNYLLSMLNNLEI